MKRILVKSNSFAYPILIGENILPDVPGILDNLGLSNRIFVLIDSKVEKLYGKQIRKVFLKKAKKIIYYSVIASEKSKSFASLKKIHSKLLNDGFGRDTLLITIGGGVIEDLGGFAAATFMRGIQLIHIPTTLLAVVDSSIGGKTGINFSNRKNIIGSFYHPQAVIIDSVFLQTLPKKEILSGAGEVIKYAFLSNQKFYNYG